MLGPCHVFPGVEFAAELCDFVKEDLKQQYPGLAEHAHITLVHSRDHILNNYDEQVENAVKCG